MGLTLHAARAAQTSHDIDCLPGTSMALSAANTHGLLGALGLSFVGEAAEIPIDAVIAACLRWQTRVLGGAPAPACPSGKTQADHFLLSCPMSFLQEKVPALHRMAVEGRRRGATLIGIR